MWRKTRLLALIFCGCALPQADAKLPHNYPVIHSDAEWRKLLTPAQYQVLRRAGTERPFSGAYHDAHQHARYLCAGCGRPLFSSDHKFDSGTGWPSFFQPIDPKMVETETDNSLGMSRTEVRCSTC